MYDVMTAGIYLLMPGWIIGGAPTIMLHMWIFNGSILQLALQTQHFIIPFHLIIRKIIDAYKFCNQERLQCGPISFSVFLLHLLINLHLPQLAQYLDWIVY